MMSYENMLFARELSLDKQRLEKQADKNKRIRNFNQTLSAMFDILGVTVNPLFALGGSVTEWLNPEKKYKTEYFLKDTVDALNRERKSNIPEWYNALLDVGTAYVGHKIGGEELGKELRKELGKGLEQNVFRKLSGMDRLDFGLSGYSKWGESPIQKNNYIFESPSKYFKFLEGMNL